MNIICERDILNGAVTPALSAVSNKGTVQALDGFLLTADKDDGTLVICGFDLEKGVKVTISGEGVQINESGKIVLNAAKFSSIIKNLPDGEVSIEADSNFAVNIKSGKSDFTLHGIDAETFPLMPELAGEKNLKLSRKVLKNMIASTLFSVGVNNSRPVLNGAFFEIKNNQLNVVATDGNRLSLRRSFEGLASDNDDNELDLSFVIPGRSLSELLKLIGDDDEPVEIELTRKHVIVSFDNIIFFSRLIESDFLDYSRIIKQIEPKTTVIADTQSLLESVERAAILTDDKQRTEVRLTFRKEEINLENKEEAGIVQVSSTGSVYGKAIDECDIEIYGEELLIAFNNRYLHEALRAVREDKIMIKLGTAMQSLVILPYNDNDDDEENENIKDSINTMDVDGSRFLYLVLPVRMRD
jgi:DNA polymerase-3 subunit beta